MNTQAAESGPLEWIFTPYDALSLDQLSDIFRLRQEVFVVEQNCAYLDIDGRDCHAQHLRAIRTGSKDERCVAYLRVLEPGSRYPEASIGRVVTAKSERGRGTGQELMRRGIEYTHTLYPNHAIRIAAQEYLARFYGSFGFKIASERFLEDGIAHVEMLLNAASK